MDLLSTDWYTEGLVVRILDSVDDRNIANLTGTIRSIRVSSLVARVCGENGRFNESVVGT